MLNISGIPHFPYVLNMLVLNYYHSLTSMHEERAKSTFIKWEENKVSRIKNWRKRESTKMGKTNSN